jgi:hypothetical protein
MIPIIFGLLTAKRQSCQGANVRRNNVRRVGLVT